MTGVPVTLSAPLWLLVALHVLTLTLHLLAMNFLAGGTVVLLLSRRAWPQLAQRLAKALPTVMAATVTLGVAPLLFLQLVYGRQVYSAAIVSGWWWLAIPFVVLIAYGLLYRQARTGPASLKASVIVALLVFVALVYTSIFSLSEAPEVQRQVYALSQAGFSLNPRAGEWLPRLLHDLAGAVMVGAWFAAWFARQDDEWRLVRRVFLGGLAAAVSLGLVYLLVLDEDLGPFMRGSGIWMTSAGIVLVVPAAVFFARRRLVVSGVMLVLSMAGMVAGRHALRDLRLAGNFAKGQLDVQAHWGQVALFLLFFVLMAGAMAWLLSTAFGRERAGSQG